MEAQVKVEYRDGIRRFIFRQSWMNTFQHCPEQARLDMHGLLPRVESDATAIGTSVHVGIEHLLDDAEPSEAWRLSCSKFDELSELPEFAWLQVKTPATAHRIIYNALWGWYDEIEPKLGRTISVEQHFSLHVQTMPCGDEIWIEGTWDYEDEHGLWDWKTAGREYQPWEVERWYVQPTQYTLAHSLINDCYPLPFNYAVMVKTGGEGPSKTQHLQVRRDEGHYKWLVRQMKNAVALYDMTDGGEHPWPLMDQGWHCSPKWCSAWSSCKGAYVS